MEQNIILLGVIILAFLIFLLVLVLYLLNKSKKTNNNQDLLKLLNDLNERNRQVLENLIKESNKDFNEMYTKFLLQNSKTKEETLLLINDQLNKIRTNIETKLNFEFEKVNKTFQRNNENLIKISKEHQESEKLITKVISENLEKINEKVENRLTEGFQQTNKAFVNMIERLSKIDEAQKKIESLSTDIVSLQDILSDKKARGSYGEVQLSLILNSNFGENNTKLFELQKKLSNETIVDAILYMPNQYGSMAIDSKFPLENYQNMKQEGINEEEKKKYEKLFKNDVKKHIDDISSKYIIQGETAMHAIMFVPSEAVFAEINAYYDDLIVYAGNKQISITSPTTLMALLKVILVVYRDNQRVNSARELFNEIEKLGKDFNLYAKRWEILQKDLNKVTKDAKDIGITTNKLTNKFEKIYLGKVEEKEE